MAEIAPSAQPHPIPPATCCYHRSFHLDSKVRSHLSPTSSDDEDAMAAALKLSPALKQLIKLPAARGAPIPSPAAPQLNALFDRVRERGEKGGISRDTWLAMNTSALFAINSPDAVCGLFDYATQGDNTKRKVNAAAIMRESGVKSISFTGIPKVINNLNALRDHIPCEVKDGLSTEALR